MPNRRDPTKTATLRGRAYRQIDTRFKRLGKVIDFVINNAFFENWQITGQQRTPRRIGNATFPQVPVVPLDLPRLRERFIYLASEQRVFEFARFTQEQISRYVIGAEFGVGVDRPYGWLSTGFIKPSYERGVLQARAALRRVARPAFFQGRAADITQELAREIPALNPAHVARSRVVYQRAFNQLKGVGDDLAARLSNTLGDAVLKGQNPLDVARRLQRDLGFSRNRARRIARTEIVRANNIATLEEFKQLEDGVGEPIRVQWSTTQDSKVRDTHASRQGQIYTQDEAQSLIGEPNCRCGLLPYIRSAPERAGVAAPAEGTA